MRWRWAYRRGCSCRRSTLRRLRRIGAVPADDDWTAKSWRRSPGAPPAVRSADSARCRNKPSGFCCSPAPISGGKAASPRRRAVGAGRPRPRRPGAQAHVRRRHLPLHTPARSAMPTCVGRESPRRSCPAGVSSAIKLTVTVFLGVDFQQHRLTPDDPSAGLRGSYDGARTGFELWYEPTAATMVAADASLSTIGPSYNVRLATGCAASTRSMSARRCRRSAPTAITGSSAPGCTSPAFAPAGSNGRPAPAGPPTATTAAAPTASSACFTRR